MSIVLNVFLCVIGWLLLGCIAVIIACYDDLKGTEFDLDYFSDSSDEIVEIILFGGISFLICFFCCNFYEMCLFGLENC